MTPMLQVGGVHDAVTLAPPVLFRAVALLVPVELAAVVKETTSGLSVLQVSGTLVRGEPSVSTTVASIGTEVPLVTLTESFSSPSARTRTYCTRQVVIGIGLLVVPETVAKSCVMPGVFPVI